MDDLKINILTQTKPNNNTDHLMGFCNLFALSNSKNAKTFIKSVCGASFDIMLTNRPRYFYNKSFYSRFE